MPTFAATSSTLPPTLVATQEEKDQEAIKKEEERKLIEGLKYLEEINPDPAMPRYHEIMEIKNVIRGFHPLPHEITYCTPEELEEWNKEEEDYGPDYDGDE